MPKLYEYLGIIAMFYANEHEPIHVHGQCQERETKAELHMMNGQVTQIVFTEINGRRPLKPSELKHFQELVEHRAGEIVQKWIDFFVLGREIKPEKITKRLK